MEPDEEAQNRLQESNIEQLEKEESQRPKFIKICKTLTKIMGIRLTDADKSGILRKLLK